MALVGDYRMNKWELTTEEIDEIMQVGGLPLDFSHVIAKVAQKKLWDYMINNVPIGREPSGRDEANRLQILNRRFISEPTGRDYCSESERVICNNEFGQKIKSELGNKFHDYTTRGIRISEHEWQDFWNNLIS
jgi:hypothetical protein